MDFKKPLLLLGLLYSMASISFSEDLPECSTQLGISYLTSFQCMIHPNQHYFNSIYFVESVYMRCTMENQESLSDPPPVFYLSYDTEHDGNNYSKKITVPLHEGKTDLIATDGIVGRTWSDSVGAVLGWDQITSPIKISCTLINNP